MTQISQIEEIRADFRRFQRIKQTEPINRRGRSDAYLFSGDSSRRIIC